jgi:hypothetical protein
MKRNAKLPFGFVVAAAAILTILAAVPGHAQNATELRSVHGTITDKADNPVAEARVYLKNTRSLTIKTAFSDQSGMYHFTGLDPNADYEIHAEHDDLTSNSRTVSSLDSRKEFVVSLKLDRKLDNKKPQ